MARTFMLFIETLFDNGAGGINISKTKHGGILLDGFNSTGGFQYFHSDRALEMLKKYGQDSDGVWVEDKFWVAVRLQDSFTGNVQDDNVVVQAALKLIYEK
jgi:hypothetical protein